jgi:hypothetical protein
LCRSIENNTEDLVVASKEILLEVIADEIKYMVMSRCQNAGRSHNIKIDSSFFERVEKFKYLGSTKQNKILFRKKLRTERIQGMLAIIRCRNFCLPEIQKYKN